MLHLATAEYWFNAGGAAVLVRAVGRSPAPSGTLVFLHGKLGHSEIWNEVLEDLGSQFRCLTIDLPGFGRSLSFREPSPSLREASHLVHEIVLRVAEGRPVALIGQDFGGVIAQLCALQWPEMAEALILINSGCIHRPPRRLRCGPGGSVLRWKLRRHLGPTALSEDRIGELLAPWRDRRERGSLLRALRSWEDTWPGPHERAVWHQAMRECRVPILLLHGARDPIEDDRECVAELARGFPHSDFFEDPTSGHWPGLENPDWMTTKVREFLFRLRPSSGVALRSAMR